MYFRIRDLCDELKKYKEIVIYGVGSYAQTIYPCLCDMGLEDRISCCTVTKLEQGVTFFNKRSYSIENLNAENRDVAILVAVNEFIEKELVDNLKHYGYKNYILLSNYRIQESGSFLKYKNQKFDQYVKYIVEWYEFAHIAETKSYSRTQVENIILSHHGKQNRKQIVIICEMLHTRHCYIFEMLIKKGYSLILLSLNPHGQEQTKRLIYNLDLKIVLCNAIDEVLYWALQYNPLVYYIIPKWSDASLASIMIQHKEHYGKLVLEIVDTMNGSYNIENELLEIEKYALENADGVIWRFFAKEYLERELGFQYRGKSIQFIDCCSGEYQGHTNEEEVLKLCMIHGGNYGLVRNVGEKDYWSREDGYVHFLTAEEIMQGITDRSDVYLHIYIGYVTEAEKEELQVVQNRYSNLKVYYNVSYDVIKRLLPQYDYGVENIAGTMLLEDEVLKKEGYLFLSGMYKFAMSQKYFDYIDAGLGITATVQKLLGDYLGQYGVIVGMEGDKLDIEYLKQNKKKYRENAEKARELLHIKNHIKDLMCFFEQL